jgi:hypothetical protein
LSGIQQESFPQILPRKPVNCTKIILTGVWLYYRIGEKITGGVFMFLIRNVFKCKPGQAKNLIERFQKSMSLMEGTKYRLLVDHVASFWTVVLETEVEDIAAHERQLSDYGSRTDVQEVMSGYLDSVESGYREIFRIV